jgi:hypothetical protein
VGYILSGSFRVSYTIPNTLPSDTQMTHPHLYLLLSQALVKTFHWCVSLFYTNAMHEVLINVCLTAKVRMYEFCCGGNTCIEVQCHYTELVS